MLREVDLSPRGTHLPDALRDWSTGTGPLYRKLADALLRAVEEGAIHPGERLPSERQLATALALSRSTVVAAYDDLRARGVLESRRGSGTRISAHVRPRRGDGRVPGGLGAAIFQRIIDGPGQLISLACAVDEGLPEVAEAVEETTRHDLPGLLTEWGYHAQGLSTLREAIAARYTATGLPTQPDEVLVTNGAHQAIVLVADLYLRKRADVVVETPGWPGCIDVFQDTGARLHPVPLDADGIEARALSRVLAERAPALIFVMPTYHNPTGRLMSAARRRQLAELAARHGVPIFEDNSYTGFVGGHGDGGPPPPVAAYAHPGTEIITVDSLSKSVWGGLRIGWIRAPAEIVERLARRRALADLGGPVLDQAVAARLLPRLDELTARRSARLGARLDLLENLLREHLPGWRWQRPDGGSSVWVRLPGSDASVFAQVALRHGVEVVPGQAMGPRGGHTSYLRLHFAFPPEVLTEMVLRLARAWGELRRHGPLDTRRPVPVV